MSFKPVEMSQIVKNDTLSYNLALAHHIEIFPNFH